MATVPDFTNGLQATLASAGQFDIDAQAYNQVDVPNLGLLSLGLQSVISVQVPDFDVTRGVAVYGTGGNENFAHLGAGTLTLYEPNNFSQINSPVGLEINVTTGNLDMTAGTAVIANSIRFTENTVPTPDEYTIDSGSAASSASARPTLIVTGAENTGTGAPGAVQVRGGVASGTNTPGASVQIAGSDSQGTGNAGSVFIAGGAAQGTGLAGGLLLQGGGDATSTGEITLENARSSPGNTGDINIRSQLQGGVTGTVGDILITNEAGANGTEGGILISISGGAGPGAPASAQILMETGGEVEVQCFDFDLQATQIGFFGAVPVTQPTDIGALTDSTGGTADNTVAAVAGSGADATINDNFADLIDQINGIRTRLRDLGLMA